MKYKPYLLFLSLLPLLSLLALPSPAHAADFSVSITPPLLEARIKPGHTIYYTFDVKNHSDQAVTLQATIQPFQPQGKQGRLRLVDDPANTAREFFSLLNAHLSLDQTFELTAGEKRQLVLRVAIPSNQTSRDYYQVLLVQQTSSPPEGQNNLTQTTGGVGVPILLNVSSNLKPDRTAEIVKFQPRKALWNKIIDSFSPLSVDLVIKNSSSSFFKPQGKLTFAKKLGSEEKEIKELPLRADNILAGGERQITCQEELCRINAPFLFGQYFVTATFKLGNTGPQYQSRLTVWVFPYKLVGLLCLAFIILYLLKQKQRIG